MEDYSNDNLNSKVSWVFKTSNVLKKIILVIAFFVFILLIWINISKYISIENSYTEKVLFKSIGLSRLIILLLNLLILFLVSKLFKKIKIRKKWHILIVSLIVIVTIVFQVLFIRYAGENIRADQENVYLAAKYIHEGFGFADFPERLKEYIAVYPHQLTLIKIYSILFNIFNSSSHNIYLAINIICNTVTIIMTTCISYLIYENYIRKEEIKEKRKQYENKNYENSNNEIKKKAKIWQVLNEKSSISYIFPTLLLCLYIPLFMLCTFFYGDIPSIMFSAIASFFLLLYTSKEDVYSGRLFNYNIMYLVASGISMAFACLVRANSLVILIAQLIYLIFDIFEKSYIRFNVLKKDKENNSNTLVKIKYIVYKILMVVLFIILSFVLSSGLLARCKKNKNLEEIHEPFPVEGFIYMGMIESTRANGWFNEDVAQILQSEKADAKNIYVESIKTRLFEFIHSSKTLINFYYYKIASIWGENTHAAIWANTSLAHDVANLNAKIEKDELNKEQIKEYKDKIKVNLGVQKYEEMINILTKSVFLYILIKGLIVIVINIFKKYSNKEVVYFSLILLGGFAFHILWEGKSRYIIPYVILLIPITAFPITKYTKAFKEKVFSLYKNIKNK